MDLIAWWRLAVLQSKRRDQHLKAILSWDKRIKRSFLSYTTMNNIHIFNDIAIMSFHHL